MLVQDVMRKNVVTIDIDSTIREAHRLMQENQQSVLPVVLEDVCAGVLTHRDIQRRVIMAGLDPDSTRVGEVMSRKAAGLEPQELGANEGMAAISERATVEEAARFMDDIGIHQLAVHNTDFQLVGIVSKADIENLVAAH